MFISLKVLYTIFQQLNVAQEYRILHQKQMYTSATTPHSLVQHIKKTIYI